MTYKNAIDTFRSRYREIGFGKQLPDLSNYEIMYKLSVVQSELNSTYKICKKRTYLNLQQGVSRYVGADFGYGGDLTFWDKVDYVVSNGYLLDNGGYKLTKSSLEQIQGSVKRTGFPQAYTYYNETVDNPEMFFEIDAVPDKSYSDDSKYRLVIQHVWKTGLFQPNVTPSIFQTYNESVSPATFGGSFLIPAEWDRALIEGALTSVFPELESKYQQYVTQALNSKAENIDFKPTYFLGFK